MKAAYKLASLVVLLCSVCISASAQGQGSINPGERIKIVALCKNDVADSYRAGIDSALSKTGMKDLVEVEHRVYYNERQGLEWLIESIQADTVDIILGPTDSGIFTRALERREELEAYTTLVVSPLVTVGEENKSDGWFFRTNVDVGRRVQVIYDYLNKCLIGSIAIFHADTEFGRRAEEAFERELRPNQRKNYQPMVIKSLPGVRLGLRQVLDSRPEAVGIFGSNEDITTIHSYLQCMNYAGVSYRPYLFTIMDARRIAEEVNDLHFVSVAQCDTAIRVDDTTATQESDEVENLAYDTCILLLKELRRNSSYDAQEFRDRFAALLRRSQDQCGPRTGMAFHNYSNRSLPRVYHLQRSGVEEVNLAQIIQWPGKLKIKWELITRRYGFLPLFNIILLFVVVIGVSILDIRRWYGKGLINEWRRLLLPLLLLVNFLVVFILYFYLAETGKIRYDSVVAAVIIAFTPSAVLRTTLFESAKGTNLAQVYDRIFMWFNDKLMMAKYRSQSSNVNVIAYYNSLSDMRSLLRQIYRNAKTEAQQMQLERELEERLQRARSVLGRRRACARILLNRLDWKELREMNLVPKAKEFSGRNPVDPEIIIRDSARYCSQDAKRARNVKTILDNHLAEVKNTNPESHAEIRRALNEALRDAHSERDRLFIRIRFLFVQFGFNVDSLIAKELLPKDFKLATLKGKHFWQGKQDWQDS